MKKIVILGATGSIGTQAIDIILQSDRYEIIGLSCNTSVKKIAAQARQIKPKYVAIHDESCYKSLADTLNDTDVKVVSGMSGIIEMVQQDEVDLVLTAVVGNIGLLPTIEAIKAGKDIALANKETLVTAGHIIMPMAAAYGVNILPVDSEHSAIFQCLNGENNKELDKIFLTASGGAFRNLTQAAIKDQNASSALKHPNWQMGPKITIDSATLMNKGLEFIEAKWLFGVQSDQIEVLVHPQSIIHSMVQFVDGSIMAQLGVPDMRVPIIYALDYPNRYTNKVPKLDFLQLQALTFMKPDFERFPCLKIAIDASKKSDLMPTIMNAANEELVAKYLKDEIKFYDISNGIMDAIGKIKNIDFPTVEDILNADQSTRDLIRSK